MHKTELRGFTNGGLRPGSTPGVHYPVAVSYAGSSGRENDAVAAVVVAGSNR